MHIPIEMSIVVSNLPSYYDKYTSFDVKQQDPSIIFNAMINAAENLAEFDSESIPNPAHIALVSKTNDENYLKIQINLFEKSNGKFLVEIQRIRGDSMEFNRTVNIIRSYIQSLVG